jgi:hypothetical protein
LNKYVSGVIRIENLKVLSSAEHRRKHKGERHFGVVLEDKYCLICGKKLENKDSSMPHDWKARKFCSRLCSVRNAKEHWLQKKRINKDLLYGT